MRIDFPFPWGTGLRILSLLWGIEAAHAQQVHLPGEDVAAALVVEIATDILSLDERLRTLEAQLTTAFRAHPHATAIESMPGFGPVLGAMLLVAAGVSILVLLFLVLR